MSPEKCSLGLVVLPLILMGLVFSSFAGTPEQKSRSIPAGDTTEKWGSSFPETIVDHDDYYPIREGLQWKFKGREFTWTKEGDLKEKAFTNTTSVTGKETVRGATVFVFQESNFDNWEPVAKYRRREDAGIFNYGADPSLGEKDAVPFMWVPLPMKESDFFTQFNLKGVDLGQDLDGDDKNETHDLRGTGTVIGPESLTLPAGTYPRAILIELVLIEAIHYTANDQTVVMPPHILKEWYAKGMGLVKRVTLKFASRKRIVQELEGVRY